MKASYRWLLELVPGLSASPKDVANRLTFAGLEVEGMQAFGAASESAIVSRVVGVKPHPSKSGLRLVTVDRGGGTQEVVCGAPNVPDPGGLVVLAPLGTHLPAKNLTIAKRAIGGVESEGMLCSEDELGLGDDHDGIIVLTDTKLVPGTTLAKVIPNASDTIFDINLPANRPDGLGHVGLARELAALFELPFSFPSPGAIERVASTATKDLVHIVVEDVERCPHYGAAAVLGITMGPSPRDIAYRLLSLGVRAISNVVDITNLVMFEYGHPMHAFDLDRIGGKKIVVRRAHAGEKMKTLDDVERVLVDDDLLICDGDGPVALAGVMGGASSEIGASTKNVLFECAWFDPRGVRRTARRHGMHTESSHRFERGVDPGGVARVLDQAVALTLSLGGAGAQASKGRLHVHGHHVMADPAPIPLRAVPLRARRITDVLGVNVPFDKTEHILERLGCTIDKRTADTCDVLVPTHRPDLGREIDLVEEVVRVCGMDIVPSALPPIRGSRAVGGLDDLARRARETAVGLGLSEAITYGFTSAAALRVLGAPEASVALENPLGEHHAVMRTTLLVGLLDAIKHARRHGERDVREFTIGPVFLPTKHDDLPHEELRIAVALAGNRPGWLEKPKPLDVWDIKGYATEIAHRLSGHRPEVVPVPKDGPSHLHPRGAALLVVQGRPIGSFGPLHPDAVSALELDGEVFVAEMAIDAFVAGAHPVTYSALARFPSATRDVALLVKDDVVAGEVERAVREAAGPLACDVHLFDRFVGDKIPKGFSSLAFRVVYRSMDRTLTDAEVDAAHANIVKDVGARFGATLRQ